MPFNWAVIAHCVLSSISSLAVFVLYSCSSALSFFGHRAFSSSAEHFDFAGDAFPVSAEYSAAAEGTFPSFAQHPWYNSDTGWTPSESRAPEINSSFRDLTFLIWWNSIYVLYVYNTCILKNYILKTIFKSFKAFGGNPQALMCVYFVYILYTLSSWVIRPCLVRDLFFSGCLKKSFRCGSCRLL